MTDATQNWPLNIDFTAAIQNPQVCFKDARLQRSQVMKNARGRVLLWSGNFATVYKLIDRECAWAVRCFTRIPQSDVQQRYAAISDHLSKHRLSYLVNFQFIPDGILVKGEWYPILKMEWVEGLELDRFIGEHIKDADRLLLLNQQLQQLKKDLRAAGIAHGDLQHGNIMVTPAGQLKLVDYDGMYVPALLGQPPVETGHPNYQPPERSPQDFGENVDDFSFDVISLSLNALAKQPELWESFHEDNKNLIFRQDDFRQPQTSPVFQSISQINDVDTQILCTQLMQKCSGDIVTADHHHRLAIFKSAVAALGKLSLPNLPYFKHRYWLAASGMALLVIGIGLSLWAKSANNQSVVVANEPKLDTNPVNEIENQPKTTIPITKEEFLNQYKSGRRDFQRVNLAGVNLNNAVLVGVNLSGANLEQAQLYQTNLSSANLRGASLEQSDLRGIDLSDTNLTDANLSNTNLGQANLTKANLLRANLNKAKMDNATLRGASLMRANLSEANLGLANLNAADLLLADLRKANLLKANLRETNLTAADLTEAKLDSADLLLADLRSAELYLANLSSANLTGVDLSSANIVLVDMAGANLSGANFSDVKIDNISSIQDANFSNVTNLSSNTKQYFCAIASGTVISTKKSTRATLNCSP